MNLNVCPCVFVCRVFKWGSRGFVMGEQEREK